MPNIGSEENGKNSLFSRPVLILRKFNDRMFLGIPLTSKIKDNKHYFPIVFKDKISCLMLSQMRVFESKRLTTLMGKVPSNQFEEIRLVASKVVLGIYPAP